MTCAVKDCPVCGGPLEIDPDGGWCPECEHYYDRATLVDYWIEENGEDEEPDEYRPITPSDIGETYPRF